MDSNPKIFFFLIHIIISRTWNGTNCAKNCEDHTHLGWGHEVKHVGKWSSTVAASKEKGHEREKESEREMDVPCVARDGEQEKEERGGAERETGENIPDNC